MTTSIDHNSPTTRFSVLDDKALNDALAYLDEQGYVVISDVLNAEEIQTNKNLLWKFLEEMNDGSIRRRDPETWSAGW